MKVKANLPENTPDNILNTIKNFINYLQNEIPLDDNVNVFFVNKRDVNMTTGVRRNGSEIYVLFGQRLLIDILRTLCHEWVHEYQYQKLGLLRDNNIQHIGGPEENMANIITGIIIKKFQKEFPDFEQSLYNE